MFKSVLTLLALGALSLHAAPILTLIPSDGIRSGTPGSVVGWGFTITNDTSLYLVVTSATETGFDPAVGTFSDFIASVNFTVVAPNSPLTGPFDNALQTGFGNFTILNTASAGNSTGANFEVNYDLLVNDPNGPLGSDPGDIFGQTFNTTQGTVNVTAVPEPSTLAMAMVALIGMGAGLRMVLRTHRG